jgi:hypothetical protein
LASKNPTLLPELFKRKINIFIKKSTEHQSYKNRKGQGCSKISPATVALHETYSTRAKEICSE